MALMIPDSIRADASQGEKTLYGILRDRLPDDFLVWYEPEIKGFYPDFVVLSPSFGLLILEVKGWYCAHIVKASKDLFEIQRKNKDGTERTASEKLPLKQGHGYFGTVTDLLVGHCILAQQDGSYKGNLAFPIGVGAIMSNITEAQAKANGLYNVLEKPQVAYRDEMLDWMNFSERDLVGRLHGMFKVYFPFMALTPDQISTIKGCSLPRNEHPRRACYG